MRSEYQAHNDLKVSKQEVLRNKNLDYLNQKEEERRARFEARISAFCKAAFWIVIGLVIAIMLKQCGVWS